MGSTSVVVQGGGGGGGSLLSSSKQVGPDSEASCDSVESARNTLVSVGIMAYPCSLSADTRHPKP